MFQILCQYLLTLTRLDYSSNFYWLVHLPRRAGRLQTSLLPGKEPGASNKSYQNQLYRPAFYSHCLSNRQDFNFVLDYAYHG